MISATRLLFLAVTLSSVLGAEYLVGVGKDETTGKKGLGFDPSVIHPTVGDTIAFQFRSGAHSAVQSTFETPCVPKEGGFDSGVITVDDATPVDAPGLPTVRITVNDTQPIWFMDQAGGLCTKGAVFAVNPSATETAATFKENAAKSPAPPPASTSASPTPTGSAGPSSSSAANPTKGVDMAIMMGGFLLSVFGWVL